MKYRDDLQEGMYYIDGHKFLQHFKGTLQQGQETWANQTTNHTTENTTGYLNYGERRRLQNN